MVEGGIHNTRLNTLGNLGAQHRFTGATGNPYPITFFNAALFSIMRMDFQHIFLMPGSIMGTTCLCANVVLRQNTPGREYQRELGIYFFGRRHILRNEELAFATHKLINMHNRCTKRMLIITWPLDTA